MEFREMLERCWIEMAQAHGGKTIPSPDEFVSDLR